MSKWLVKFEGNYADEFDCQGFCILDNRMVYDEFIEHYKTVEKPFEAYFGTNEFLVFEDGQDLLRYFSIVEISDDQVNALSLLYSYPAARTYGIFPFWKLLDF